MKSMKNEYVLNYFMLGREAQNSGKNLISYGTTLFNYNTKIAQHYGKHTLINGHKYSSTTSKHQNYLKTFSGTVVVPKEDFEYITNLDYDMAYFIVETMFCTSDDDCVDYTSMLKRDKPLVEKGQKILYENKK